MRVVVVNDTRVERHFGCDAVMGGLFRLLREARMEVLHCHPVGKDWRDSKRFDFFARQADLIVVNGEGSIHHGNQRARALAALGPHCRVKLNRPCALINATLFANSLEVERNLGYYDLVAVRDAASFALAERASPRQALWCPDLLFYRVESFRVRDGRPRRGIGITDSVSRTIAAWLEGLQEQGRLIALPALKGSNPAVRRVRDYATAVQNLECLITGRYHSLCYALAAETPFLAVESNTPKLSFLINDVFGSAERRVVSPNMDWEEIRQEFRSFDEDELTRLRHFRACSRDAFSRLRSALGALK